MKRKNSYRLSKLTKLHRIKKSKAKIIFSLPEIQPICLTKGSRPQSKKRKRRQLKRRKSYLFPNSSLQLDLCVKTDYVKYLI